MMETKIQLIYSIFVLWMTIRLRNVKADLSEGGTYCFSRDTNPYRDFGSCTTYKRVSDVSDMKIPLDKTCKPTYVYGLIRSGIRYYSGYNAEHLKSLQRQILANHDEANGRGKLCSDDLMQLKSWSSLGAGKTSDDIAQQGKIESSELGSRLAQKFKAFGAIDSDHFRFVNSNDKTSLHTATAFVEGMFGQTANVKMSLNGELLRFIENSKELDSKLSKPAFAVRDVCVNSEPMRSLTKEVSDRLGFSDTLPAKSIEDMYFSCAFETAWTPKMKPGFCAAFTRKHLQLLEYCYMDILGYYEWGYGSEHAPKVPNPIIDDLLLKMKAATQLKNGQLKGDFNFASGAALTHTITKLGLYRDEEPISPSNYGSKKHQKQKWSMSQICPFNGNLIAVLHKCGKNELKVSVYHNERPVIIPGCSTQLCSWSKFQDIIRSPKIRTGATKYHNKLRTENEKRRIIPAKKPNFKNLMSARNSGKRTV